MTLSAISISVISGAAAILSAYFLAMQIQVRQTIVPVLSATRADDPTGYWSGIVANMCVVAVLGGICLRQLIG